MITSRMMTACMMQLAMVVLLGGCLSSGGESDASLPPDGGPSPGTGNRTPQIAGLPPGSASVGNSYTFRPNASDADGDTMTFTIQNQPSWASFSNSTGELSGVPELGDIGSYPNIIITVSDGQSSASLAGFAITVSQMGSGSATLTWTPPTQNSDGTALTNLAGYKIYYGVTSRVYTNQVAVNNAGITTFVVENLAPNTYYFAATAVNSLGIESDLSVEAIKVVN